MFNNLNLTSNDSFLGSNSDIESVNSSFDYHSFYRAIVKSNYDPDHLGRIRICIPALHSKVSTTNQYPWAYPGCFVGLGNQTGQFILPPVGSIVFVTFEYSDEHRPIYFGGVPTVYSEGKTQSYGALINNGVAKEVTTDDIPTEYTGSESIIYKSPTGAIIYMNDSTHLKEVIIKDSSGQKFVQKSYINASTQEEYKSTEVSVDKENKVLIEKDKLTVTLSGYSITFTAEDLKNIGTGGGTPGPDTDELIVWDSTQEVSD